MIITPPPPLSAETIDWDNWQREGFDFENALLLLSGQ
jgi:hypothetical protein